MENSKPVFKTVSGGSFSSDKKEATDLTSSIDGPAEPLFKAPTGGSFGGVDLSKSVTTTETVLPAGEPMFKAPTGGSFGGKPITETQAPEPS